MLDASIRALLPEAKEKAVTIAHEPGADHFVFLDPSKIKQVFVHLLSNAVKFNGEGGSVSVATTRSPVGDLVVAVRDTGCGIPPQDLERVLEPFSQVEDHLTRENEGVGLGLPFARAMTGMHGGALTLTSQIGVGTVVAITLPAARLRTTPAG